MDMWKIDHTTKNHAVYDPSRLMLGRFFAWSSTAVLRKSSTWFHLLPVLTLQEGFGMTHANMPLLKFIKSRCSLLSNMIESKTCFNGVVGTTNILACVLSTVKGLCFERSSFLRCLIHLQIILLSNVRKVLFVQPEITCRTDIKICNSLPCVCTYMMFFGWYRSTITPSYLLSRSLKD